MKNTLKEKVESLIAIRNLIENPPDSIELDDYAKAKLQRTISLWNL